MAVLVIPTWVVSEGRCGSRQGAAASSDPARKWRSALPTWEKKLVVTSGPAATSRCCQQPCHKISAQLLGKRDLVVLSLSPNIVGFFFFPSVPSKRGLGQSYSLYWYRRYGNISVLALMKAEEMCPALGKGCDIPQAHLQPPLIPGDQGRTGKLSGSRGASTFFLQGGAELSRAVMAVGGHGECCRTPWVLPKGLSSLALGR